MKKGTLWSVMTCIGIIGAIMLLAVSVSQAAPIQAIFDQGLYGRNVDITFQGQNWLIATELFQWTVVSGNFPVPEFYAFCIELTQPVWPGVTVDYEVKDVSNYFSDDMVANAFRELWGEAFDSVNDEISSAAFQVVTWEIVYDDSWNLSGGNFIVNDLLVRDQANALLNAIDGSGPMATVWTLNSSEYQDLMTGYVESYPIPEPASILLISIGLLIVARVGKKKIRRKS